MLRRLPVLILSSRAANALMVIAYLLILAGVSFFGHGRGDMDLLFGLGDRSSLVLPMRWLPLVVGAVWVIAGFRLKAFLDRPSLSFERSRYSMLYLLIWTIPSLVYPGGLSVALVSWLSVEVMLQALQPQTREAAVYHGFIAGLYLGLLVLLEPWAALLILVFLSVLQNAGLLSWRAVVWIVLSTLVPWLVLSGVNYVMHGQAHRIPLISTQSESPALDLRLHWTSLVWVVMGTALLIQSTYSVILLSSTASSKQRLLHNAAIRALLCMFLFLIIWSFHEGSWSYVAFLAVPASILLSVVIQSLGIFLRICFWIWVLSAVFMFIVQLYQL